MKFYPYGKDEQDRPCIELDEGSVHTDLEVILALIRALLKKGTLTKQEIKNEL